MSDLNLKDAERVDAAQAMACLDLTDLSDTCGAADIARLCQRAQGGGAAPAVAAVCVWPAWVATARQALPAHIGVAAVVNFPRGQGALPTVLAEIETLRAGGATEVDCVWPHRAWRDGDREGVLKLMAAVRAACPGLRLKVIMESGEWADLVALRAACDAALALGADFLKTSTGKVPGGASLDAVAVMLDAIAARPDAVRLGLKASGGLRTLADVRPYLTLVRARRGEAGLSPSRFRIGASGLWSDLAHRLGAASDVASGNGASPAY